MNPILKARKNLIYKLREKIADWLWKKLHTQVNEVELDNIIDVWLPDTYAEQEAEIDETEKQQKHVASAAKRKPSQITLLREALEHTDKNIDLFETLKAATEAVLKLKEMEK